MRIQHFSIIALFLVFFTGSKAVNTEFNGVIAMREMPLCIDLAYHDIIIYPSLSR